MTVLATYVHHLDPYIARFGSLGPRWYGLAYLLGFAAAIMLLRWLKRRDIGLVPVEKISDFVIFAAIFGVMLGGRLGYFLLYDQRGLLENPVAFIKLWDGGMASHGGIMGLFFYTLFYARRHGLSWTGVGDNLCLAATPGLFLVRMANFINGELWGRPTSVSWGVKFPDELLKRGDLGVGECLNELATLTGRAINVHEAIELSRRSAPAREIMAKYLTTRHPSQIYEGLLEGVALFAVLLFVRLRWQRAPFGLLTGLFFTLYAAARIFGERFREPDHSLIGPLTRGQFYSLFMIFIGGAFLLFAWKSPKARPTNPAS